MDELKKKTTSTDMNDENNHENLINLKVIDFKKNETILHIVFHLAIKRWLYIYYR
jgi:hypothetical protein